MEINIVAIGNSQGVRIPKAILEQCHIKKKIDLVIDKDKIIIRPLEEKPRDNWTNMFKDMAKNTDDQLLINDGVDLHMDGWEW